MGRSAQWLHVDGVQTSWHAWVGSDAEGHGLAGTEIAESSAPQILRAEEHFRGCAIRPHEAVSAIAHQTLNGAADGAGNFGRLGRLAGECGKGCLCLPGPLGNRDGSGPSQGIQGWCADIAQRAL